MGGGCVGECMCNGRGLVEYPRCCFLRRYPRNTRSSSDAIAANDPMARPMMAAVESWLSWGSGVGIGDGIVVLSGLRLVVDEELGSVEEIAVDWGPRVGRVIAGLLVERLLEAFDEIVVPAAVLDTETISDVEVTLKSDTTTEVNTLVVVTEIGGGGGGRVDLITIESSIN